MRIPARITPTRIHAAAGRARPAIARGLPAAGAALVLAAWGACAPVPASASIRTATAASATTSGGVSPAAITPPVCFDQTVQVAHDSPGVRVQLHCDFGDTTLPTIFGIVAPLPSHGYLKDVDLIHGTLTYVPLFGGYVGTDSLEFDGYTGTSSASNIATVTFNLLPPAGGP
jgi:hypothetical protein